MRKKVLIIILIYISVQIAPADYMLSHAGSILHVFIPLIFSAEKKTILKEDDDDDFDSFENEFTTIKHTFKGHIEIENYFAAEKEQEDLLQKNELRSFLSYRAGTPLVYAVLETNMYGIVPAINKNYSFHSDFNLSTNLTMSMPFAEINFPNLYVNWDFDKYRLRAGLQRITWGTADVFSVISFFTPYDLSEFLVKDPKEMKQSIPSILATATFGKHMIEVIFSPFHVPAKLATTDNFWAVSFNEGPFPVTVSCPEFMGFVPEAIAAGLRYYTNIWNTDIHLVYYHGPDREPALVPKQALSVPGMPVSIEVVPETHPVDVFGFAVSKTIGKFALQLESAYSFNKTAVIDHDLEKITVSEITGLLPFKTNLCHMISYTAGVNWFIPLNDWIKGHKGESVITLEWTQTFLLHDNVRSPLLTDLLLVRLQDTFFSEALQVSLTGIIDVSHGSFVIWPRAAYTFKFGMSIDISYVLIIGSHDSLIGYYDNNDIFTVRLRYVF